MKTRIAFLAIALIANIPILNAATSDVNVLPLTGPLASANVSPANGSATAYLMNYQGQKAVCFQNNAATEVYIGSSTVSTSNGYPLISRGTSLCADLKGGTTVYMFGNGAGADIRVIAVR